MPTIVTAVIVLLIIFGLVTGFVFLHKRRLVQRNKAKAELLNNAGIKQGLTFSGQEILEKTLLGLDGIQQVLMVIEPGTTPIIYCIRLADVATCIIHKEYEKINTGTDNKERIELELRSIELLFSFKKRPGTLTISFYDNYINHPFEKNELETKARQWETLLSKMIVSEKHGIKI